MAITAAQVKELRERTGSGMMECKKALVECDGDIEAAVELMRKSGAAKADKKAGRTAAEGMIPFDRSLLELYRTGKITEEVALQYASSPTDLRLKLEGF